MPSHFTHLVFAEEAVTRALGAAGSQILAAHGPLLRLGAQGPDIFYHNQRTLPTGLRYGVALHRRGFGALVECLVREARRLGMGPGSELGAFILGFATHGPLDCGTHPFIGYFSGWVDPHQPQSNRYFRCHAFLERLLDVAVLRERRGIGLEEFDFLPQVRGRGMPYPVLKAMVKGLNATYPSFERKSLNRKRVENAYHDTIFFYKLTNHRNPEIRRLAWRKDRADGFHHRRLAFLHPREVPADLDVLNRRGLSWCHPCDREETSSAGFLELYEAALAVAVAATRRLQAALAGDGPVDGVAALVGDQSLDTGREPCLPRFSNPLPLAELLDSMYGALEAEAAPRSR